MCAVEDKVISYFLQAPRWCVLNARLPRIPSRQLKMTLNLPSGKCFFNDDGPQPTCDPSVSEKNINLNARKKGKKFREIRLSVSVFICSEIGPGAPILG